MSESEQLSEKVHNGICQLLPLTQAKIWTVAFLLLATFASIRWQPLEEFNFALLRLVNVSLANNAFAVARVLHEIAPPKPFGGFWQ